MNDIQKWFEEAIEVAPVFETSTEFFIIYKGFKVVKSVSGYDILDVRMSNMYSAVCRSDMDTIKANGFVKGVDIISCKRDQRRVSRYKRQVYNLEAKRKRFKAELPNNKRLNEKRIRNIRKKIQQCIDFIYFYETRIEQFNIKYS